MKTAEVSASDSPPYLSSTIAVATASTIHIQPLLRNLS